MFLPLLRLSLRIGRNVRGGLDIRRVLLGILATRLVVLSYPSVLQPMAVERNPHGTHVSMVSSGQREAMQMPYPLHLGARSGQRSSTETFLDVLVDSCQTLHRVVLLGVQHITEMDEHAISAPCRWRPLVRGLCLDIDQRAPPERSPP